MTEFRIFPAEHLAEITPDKGLILDVRTTMEHDEKHLSCVHVHVPLDALDPAALMAQRGLGQDFPVYIVCKAGARAEQAAQKFIAQGFTHVFVVRGGLVGCEACGHALEGYGVGGVVQSCCFLKRPVSLERQVRITAGLFIVAGCLLALFSNLNFIAVPLFVGCGLIFAGMTDRCGMMLILTKAPWNKK